MELGIARDIPDAVKSLEQFRHHEIDHICCGYQQGGKGKHRQTPAHAPYGGNGGCCLVYRALRLLAVVGGTAHEGKTRAPEEGEELHALARIKDAAEHQHGGGKHHQGEEPAHVPLLPEGQYLAARGVLQLVIGVAHHVGDAEAHPRKRQESSEKEERNQTQCPHKPTPPYSVCRDSRWHSHTPAHPRCSPIH